MKESNDNDEKTKYSSTNRFLPVFFIGLIIAGIAHYLFSQDQPFRDTKSPFLNTQYTIKIEKIPWNYPLQAQVVISLIH